MPIQQVKIRGFEVAKGFEEHGVTLPTQATEGSAGYDFHILEDCTILPNETKLIATGIKAYMKLDEVLELYIRSSMALKYGLTLGNNVGIVDSTYYENPDNDGHIMFMVNNTSDRPVTIKKGDRIGQGIFKKYLTADSGNSKKERKGGFGSTNKQGAI